MDPLNSVEGKNEVYFEVTPVSATVFKINVDTTSYPPYISGGVAYEKKKHVQHQFVEII